MEYYEHIYAIKVDGWDEMDKFLERKKLLKMNPRRNR